MECLIDTNILSELRKGARANVGVLDWFSNADGNQLYISVLTLGEIRQGIEQLKRRDVQAAESLQHWLRQIEMDSAHLILPVTQAIADRWGHINVPDKLPIIDGFLAATALVHDLTLVTRNVRDVERSGVKLLNPFREESGL
jgi:predicted nucleic acid-binding protein